MKLVKNHLLISAAFFFVMLHPCFALNASPQAHVNVIQIQDTINPGVEDFLKYSIDRSVEDKAEFMIILLDTPGGLMTSMRGMAQAILNSGIPIVVYVYPSGAQAASAGVFITAAADIAAMAPGNQHRGRASGHRGWRRLAFLNE